MPTNTRRKKVAKKATKKVSTRPARVSNLVTLTLKQAEGIQARLLKAGVVNKTLNNKIVAIQA